MRGKQEEEKNAKPYTLEKKIILERRRRENAYTLCQFLAPRPHPGKRK